MKKENLVDFINRFYLQGALTKDSSGDWCPVEITVQDGVAKVIIKADISLLCVIDQNLDMPDGTFVIGNVKQFLSMVQAFGQNLNVELKMDRQSYNNIMRLKDENLEATVALADPQVIENRPKLNSTPDPDLSFDLKKDFIERFIKAKKAINDAKYFAVFPDDMSNSVDFIVNYSQDQNTNNIKVTNKEVTINNEFEPLYFDTNNFTAILQENSDFRTGTIGVSSKGLMYINFKGEDWESNYYVKAYQN